MEFWFSRTAHRKRKAVHQDRKAAVFRESEYQRIDVFDSEEFGKFISLDGEIVFSEKDEFIYDEMVTHVPMAVHPCVKDVLIIGGGDGGVAKELLQYDCVEHIDVVETDEMFVEVSRKFFPEVACALDDPRVEVHYDDGLRFLRNKKAKYDLIINDSTDPSATLRDCSRRNSTVAVTAPLKEDGIMVYQHGSPFYDEDELACRSMHRKAFRSFPISRVSGTYSNLSVRILALRLRFKEISSHQGFQTPGMGCIKYRNMVLHDTSSHGSVHAAEVC